MSGTPGQINYREIIFDTRDRVAGTVSNPTFNIQQTMKIKQIQIPEAIIPYTWYVFTALNNKVDFFEPASGPITTVTIAPGNYTSTTFINALKAALDAASPNGYIYTITINSTTSKITISSTGIFHLLWASGPNAANTPRIELGFSAIDLTAASTYTAQSVYDFSGPDYIYIKCTNVKGFDNEITNSNTSIDSQIVAIVPVVVGTGQTIYHNSIIGNATQMLFGDASVSQLSFKLTTRNNVLLDLNGKNWMMKVGIFD